MIVKLVNLLLVSNQHSLNKNYANLMKDSFNSSIESVDFVRNSDKITNHINDWVSEQTNGKIKDFFKSSITSDTVLVLVNAIYFKGLWKYPFDQKNTVKDDFYNMGNNKSIKVDMMSIITGLKVLHNKELNARIFVLPFVSASRMSMIIVRNIL